MAQITVAPGEARTDVDFGYDFLFGSCLTPAGISGQVWIDLDADGLSNPLLARTVDHGVLIVELKYDDEHETQAARVASRMPFRMTRRTKYVRRVEFFL